MGGKTLYLFCTHALAAFTLSSLEWKPKLDQQNPVAASLTLSDRSCIKWEHFIHTAIACKLFLKGPYYTRAQVL